jgi:hypothetical protein
LALKALGDQKSICKGPRKGWMGTNDGMAGLSRIVCVNLKERKEWQLLEGIRQPRGEGFSFYLFFHFKSLLFFLDRETARKNKHGAGSWASTWTLGKKNRRKYFW